MAHMDHIIDSNIAHPQRRSTGVEWAGGLIFLLPYLLNSSAMAADIYRCQSANGNPVFQSSPCDGRLGPTPPPQATPLPTFVPASGATQASAPLPTPDVRAILPTPSRVTRPVPTPAPRPLAQRSDADEVRAPEPTRGTTTKTDRPSTFDTAVWIFFDVFGFISTFLGVIGYLTFLVTDDSRRTQMPPGPYRGGDILGHRFWWCNLVIAFSIGCYVIPPLRSVIVWAFIGLSPFSALQWTVLIVLWVVTMAWLGITWLLVKSSLDAGRLRHFSVWGQYVWIDEIITPKTPEPPLGRWLPSTDPSHGPEHCYWESYKTRDQVRKDFRLHGSILFWCFVAALFFFFVANGALALISVFLAFFMLIGFLIWCKVAALYYHLGVMEIWAAQARGTR